MAESNRIEGNLIAGDKKIGIVIARWNEFFTKRLLEGAKDAWIRHGGNASNIVEIWVPGSFEVPLAAAKLIDSDKIKLDGVICLGCLIRGATPHFDYIAGEATKGIGSAAMSSGLPVSYGIITVDSIEQAIERAGTKAGNKGAEAAVTLIEMMNIYDQL